MESQSTKDSSNEEQPNYELEYEILSAGSVEPWDDTDVTWVSATNDTPAIDNERIAGGDMKASTSQSQSRSQKVIEIERERAIPEALEEPEEDNDAGKVFELEDMEQLMAEIGNMRDSLRLMPDFQRREMAAN